MQLFIPKYFLTETDQIRLTSVFLIHLNNHIIMEDL